MTVSELVATVLPGTPCVMRSDIDKREYPFKKIAEYNSFMEQPYRAKTFDKEVDRIAVKGDTIYIVYKEY